MVEYLIVRCPNCGCYSAMKSGVRTHVCPYCGRSYKLEEYTIVKRVGSGREAREIIKQLNLPRALREKLYGREGSVSDST